jgi:hypothetical protein
MPKNYCPARWIWLKVILIDRSSSKVEAQRFSENPPALHPVRALQFGTNTVKKLFDIPVPSRDVTYQTLSVQE